MQYPLHSLIVFNSDNKAIPVAWIIAPRFSSIDAHRWMRALYNRVRTKDPTWKLAGFIVDDPSADVLTIRDVFQCSVLISFWRVRHAWHKNLVKRCSESEMRAEIFRRLGQAVDDICKGHGTLDLFEDCMEDFMDGSDFMDYFKAVWYPRMGAWITALKTLPLASQETSATMEFHHNQLKLRLLNEKDPGVYQRADWLVDKLGTKVHSYFWLDEYSGKDDFVRYWKDEWVSGLTSWRRALKIPDPNVVIEGRFAKVVDQHNGDKAHVVWNPGSQFGICDCSWSGMGYLCEHVLKIIKFCREKGSIMPSISLFQYKQALIDMLHCSPHDSLIRDHAVSLAIFVQKQLNELLDLQSSQTAVSPIEKQTVDVGQQTVGMVSTGQDTELVNENQGKNEDISSHNEKGCVNGQDLALGGIANDLGGGLINQVVSGDSICGETTEEENSCGKTDVDRSSICISTPGLFSVDDIISGDGFSNNEDRVLINADPKINNKSLSKDAVFTDQNGTDKVISNRDCHQGLMDVESLAINTPSPTMEFLDQCTVTPQIVICSNDAELSVLCNKSDSNSLPDKTSLPMPVTVESKVVNVTETSGVVKDNGIKLKSDNQHPVEVATQETDSYVIPSSDEPSIVRCKPKRRAEDGSCGNEIIVYQRRQKRR